jgi:hypothetical protein
MSLRTSLLSAVDAIRGSVPGALDLRQFAVTVRVRTWTGTRVGLGTKTDVDTTLMVGGYNPNVERISAKDVVASGGLYTAGDYRIGPLTPAYATGGTAVGAINPPTATAPQEVLYHLVGPGLPSGGQWCKRVSDETDANFRYEVVVRAMAVTP